MSPPFGGARLGLKIRPPKLIQFSSIRIRGERRRRVPHGFWDKVRHADTRESDIAVLGRGCRSGWSRWRSGHGSVEDSTNGSGFGDRDPDPPEGGGFTQKISSVTGTAHPGLKNGTGRTVLHGSVDIFRQIFPPIFIQQCFGKGAVFLGVLRSHHASPFRSQLIELSGSGEGF